MLAVDCYISLFCSAIGVEQVAAEVNNGFAVPVHAHALAISHLGNLGVGQVFSFTKLDESR